MLPIVSYMVWYDMVKKDWSCASTKRVLKIPCIIDPAWWGFPYQFRLKALAHPPISMPLMYSMGLVQGKSKHHSLAAAVLNRAGVEWPQSRRHFVEMIQVGSSSPFHFEVLLLSGLFCHSFRTCVSKPKQLQWQDIRSQSKQPPC